MRVLLVEDDAPLADVIARGLRRDAFAVDVAHDGGVALHKASEVEYDVIVLDRDLPVVHGDEVCRQLTNRRALARILMLTAAGRVNERIEGLRLGADDYLPKPFDMDELTARLHALARRASRPRPPTLEWHDLRVDPGAHTATRAGRDLNLTNREFALLTELLLEPGVAVSAEELMERVWDDELDPFSNAVRVTVATLRRKLGEPPIILNVPRVGYRLEAS
jgi:DNA-binding response OmpR family regulator